MKKEKSYRSAYKL